MLDIEPNVNYDLTPYALTNRGIIYGETKELIINNSIVDAIEDSISITIYPNPSNGDFNVRIQMADEQPLPAFLRIVDMNVNRANVGAGTHPAVVVQRRNAPALSARAGKIIRAGDLFTQIACLCPALCGRNNYMD